MTRVSSLSDHPVLAGSVLMSQAITATSPKLVSSRLTRSNEYLLCRLNIMTKNEKYQRLELVCLLLLSLTDLVTEMSKHVSAVVVAVALVMPQHST